MDAKTAYVLTKIFWQNKKEMGTNSAWWNGVTPDDLITLGAILHPGAARYYREVGIAIPDNLK